MDVLSEKQKRIVEENIKYALGIAGNFYKKRRHLNLEIDELKQVALLGLCKAAIRYRREEASFTTFAYWRIHGSLLDYLKKDGPVPRWCIPRKDDDDPDSPLGQKNYNWEQKKLARDLMYAQDLKFTQENNYNPDLIVTAKANLGSLKKKIEKLPQIQQDVTEKVYIKDLSLVEVADKKKGYSPSMVNRSHKCALKSLRESFIAERNVELKELQRAA